MNVLSKMPRTLMLATIFVMGAAGRAGAASNPVTCTNDTDCAATPACGGDVCEWPDQKCVPASASVHGWCTVANGDANCKCAGIGAKCVGVYCTVIMPPSGGAGTGGGAGTSGGAGTGGGAGTTGHAGTSGAAGTTGAAGTGTSGGGGGGCSIGAVSSGGLGAVLGLALVAGGIVRRRRRR